MSSDGLDAVPPGSSSHATGSAWRGLSGMSHSGLFGLAVLLFWMLMAVIGPWVGPHDPGAMGAEVFAPGGPGHWLGTDYLGRDILSRVLSGARTTVGLALGATLLASGVGTLLALLAAACGGWIDVALSRALDTLISIPSKMLALVVVAAVGTSLPVLALTAAVVYTPGAFRIARSLAVNINAMDYVVVARTRGENVLYIMRHEILPNIAGPMLADLGLRFVYVLLLLASLSFLGLGVQPPSADWGSLVRENIEGLSSGALAVIAPALSIATLTIAVNLVIDGLPGRAVRDGDTS